MPVEQKVRFDLPLPASDSSLPEDYDEMVTLLTKALQEKKQGKDGLYLVMIDSIQKKILNDIQVKALIRAVSGSLSHQELSKDLIYALVALDWLNKPSDFVSCYLHFLQNVVSVNAVFVTAVIAMLVDCFVSGPEAYPDIPCETIFDYTHTAMIKILKLIPRGPGILLPILSQKLPHKSDSSTVQKLYVKSLLYIAEYAPVIRDELIRLVLELIVQIDIEIQVEDLEDEEDQDIFPMEMSKEEAGSESEESESDAGSLLCISSDSKIMTSKLDALLCIMFDYTTALSKKTDDIAQDFSLVFDGMLHTFDNIMLPTHKLRSAQFIIFYFCSLEPSFAQDFMGLLVTHLVEPSNSSVIRMASSSYLGSFIARAKFIDIPSVRQCLSILNHQCQTYIEQHESGIKGRLEVDRYGVLYGSVQAILYIFCFRWKQLMRIEEKPLVGAFPPELAGFQRVLLSKFHPLKVCSEAIVAEFAKITNNLNIIYCYTLMQSGSGAKPESSPSVNVCERLDTFFPFDPLYPPTSKAYIQEIFQEWEGADDNDNDVPDSDISASMHGMSLDDRLGMSMSMSLSIN